MLSGRAGPLRFLRSMVAIAVVAIAVPAVRAEDPADSPALARFQREVKPLLIKYCYECHGAGAKEGNRAFDALEKQGLLLGDHKLWSLMIKNVRTGIMPPPGQPRPAAGEVKQIASWAYRDVFQIDPLQVDPGRTVLRRLNRLEYQNTIRDLLGYDFDAQLYFPPDDTGYGFDTTGDTLVTSPLLTEKYLEAAERIVDAAAPKVSRQPAEKVFLGKDFADELTKGKPQPEARENDRRAWPRTGEETHFHEAADLRAVFTAPLAGKYELDVELRVDGQFEYSPLRSHAKFFLDGEELINRTFVYHDGETYHYRFNKDWEAGEHPLRFDLQPLPAAADAPRGRPDVFIRFKVIAVRVKGPLDRERWIKPANFDRLYPRELPPDSEAERLSYAREVLAKFALRAFRRPADDAAVQRLAEIAAREYQQPGTTFEEGIARALIAILASPRFLYRTEGHLPKAGGATFPQIDEFALATRLSYFLWSTMPDDELFRLAQAGQLRQHLDQQIARMVADERSKALAENFAGQWLRTRDVAHVRIDARAVVAADMPPSDRGGFGERGRGFGRGFGRGGPTVSFDSELRTAMRQETELQFAYLMRDNRSLLELLDCDYAFLNQRLAEHYKIEGVEGREMRLVKLPPDSPRGGLLTQGSFLTITSNPDRTSPVKRGLFILDNILGTAPPPPPPDVPDLEKAAGKFEGRTPALREVLELHRSDALCSACHARMDALGLALENFNALGMWRTTDRQQPIDPKGSLISGEKFESATALKKLLKENKRQDFYYCLTEKLLTYALGRGVEVTDELTVEQIVAELERHEGKFSALLAGIVHSPQFQRRREPEPKSALAK